MNPRKIILIPIIVIITVCSIFSCGVDRWSEYAPLIALDSWIDDVMRENYLWYKDMPDNKKMNLFLEPKSFLSKAISSSDKGYSYIDSILDTSLPTYGFDYSLVRNQTNDAAYNALITYVIPNSPADKAGLKRGEWIMKVDGQYISRQYESQLLQGTKSITLTIGTYQKIESKDKEEDGKDQYDVVAEREGVVMGEVESISDTPIYTYKTLNLSNGAPIGYLMYNSFTAGTNDAPEKYNNELRKISQEFHKAQIQALVLDLRNNKGGSIGCAQLLATLLAPANFLDSKMASLTYNDKNESRNTNLTFDSKLLKDGVNLNLSIIIVLTSSTTAGASEMVMHCLNGKTEALISIGGVTKGQSVATERFVNEEHRWALNLAVCTVANSADEVQKGGFSATYNISESSDYTKFLPFGDSNELLLNTAIGVLEGTYPPKNDTKATTSARIKIVKSVSSSASRRFNGGLQIQ